MDAQQMIRLTVLAGIGMFLVGEACAQTPIPLPPRPVRSTDVSPALEHPAAEAPSVPPYNAPLLRLIEITGTVSYLQYVCNGSQSTQWWQRIEDLIDAEAPNPARRDQLVATFNQGFHSYELTYRRCNDNARLIINRFVSEGDRLVQQISSRFGG